MNDTPKAIAPCVLIIGKVWPEPASSAAGLRMTQLISFFQSAGYLVYFGSAARKTEFSLDTAALHVHEVEITLNDPSFDEMLLLLKPSVVVFDRFSTEEQYGWRVSANCPSALRILNTEDLHGLREERMRALKNDPAQLKDHSETLLREIAAIYRCDLSIIISSYEMSYLVNELKIPPAILTYFPLLAEPFGQRLPEYSERRGFIFIGNFLHRPNHDAVQYLKTVIWPLIRQELPDAELLVYGAYGPPEISRLHNEKEGFFIMGRAADSREVLKNARVLLAPLRFGAGLKGKIIEAMSCRAAIVTTSIGAEGIFENDHWFISDDPATFAEAAVKMNRSESLFNDAVTAGEKILIDNFSKERHFPAFAEAMRNISNNLVAHRKQNVTGAAFWLQSTLSTKYMSLWIESKNELKKLLSEIDRIK
jgi:O-antigen biosynthesis protein